MDGLVKALSISFNLIINYYLFFFESLCLVLFNLSNIENWCLKTFDLFSYYCEIWFSLKGALLE
jgi:hypothetical protein